MPTEDLYTAYTMDWWEALAASCESDGLMTPPNTSNHPCRDTLLSYGGGSPGVGPCRPPDIDCARDPHCSQGVFCVQYCAEDVVHTEDPRSLFLESSTSYVWADDAIVFAPWNLFAWRLPGINKIVDDPSEDQFDSEVAFINGAFNLLLDNLDVVEYVLCMLAGSNVASCVVDDLVSEENGGETIRFDSSPAVDYLSGLTFRDLEDCMWVTGLGDGRVRLDYDCPEFVALLQGFFSKDPNEKLCAVAQLAAQLLSQFTKDCTGPNDIDDDAAYVFAGLNMNLPPLLSALYDLDKYDQCACDLWDMIENSFMWAISQRFPCLRFSDCAIFRQDCAWFSPCDKLKELGCREISPFPFPRY